MKYLILGCQGQLGSALAQQFPQAICLSHHQADFLSPASVLAQLERIQPDVVFNAVAHTQVDQVRMDSWADRQVNIETPTAIARWLQGRGIFFHFSSDYVFAGKGTYCENEPPNPVNDYGRTKYLSEQGVLGAHEHCYVIRLSRLYHQTSQQHFIARLKQALRQHQTVPVVIDQYTSPSSANWVAAQMPVFLTGLPVGIYHLVPDHCYTLYDFAQLLLQQWQAQGLFLDRTLRPILTSDLSGGVPRPLLLRLDNSKYKKAFTKKGLNVKMLDFTYKHF